jgi:ubiquinone biosynthesis protein UbiJ
MSTPALLCAALEVALNRYLRQEPTVLAEWSRLEGRCVALEANDLGWRFLVEPLAGGVRISADTDLQPSVTIRATTAQVLSAALRNLGSELLDRFARLLRRVGFDIEEPLARVFGDSAAHRIADGLRGLLGWSRNAGRRLALDTSEYLREEARELAGAAEVEEWMHEVDTLREGVDRLEARLMRLERSARKERTA